MGGFRGSGDSAPPGRIKAAEAGRRSANSLIVSLTCHNPSRLPLLVEGPLITIRQVGHDAGRTRRERL